MILYQPNQKKYGENLFDLVAIPGSGWAEVVLRVEQFELHGRWGAGISGYQVAELAENVTTNFDHVLMTGSCLQSLETSGITKYVLLLWHLC